MKKQSKFLYPICILVGIVVALTLYFIALPRLPTQFEENTRRQLSALAGLGVAVYLAVQQNNKKRYRNNDAYGSAKWGNPKKLNKKYSDTNKQRENIIFTENFSLALDGIKKKHFRNLNSIVVGGSGAGKTRYYVLPNILQMNSSYIILDPKGEILYKTKETLEKAKYVVKEFNVIDTKSSNKVNLLKYTNTEADCLSLVNTLIHSTTPSNASKGDPFWEKSETALILAMLFYIKEELVEEQHNFNVLCDMVGSVEALEDDRRAKEQSEFIDQLFKELKEKNPDHIAVKYFDNFRKYAPNVTARSILMSVAVRLAPLYIQEIADIISTDELELDQLGRRKTALFLVVPDNDTTFNFMISMIYQVLFKKLYFIADREYKGKLPVPVHFLMDEFANVHTPENFNTVLATCRSRNIMISIILQSIAQLKTKFPQDKWQELFGSCDSFLYLGGNDESTHKYVSSSLGKETITTINHSISKGRGGSSKSIQLTGRELLTPDEVKKLDRNMAIFFLSGEDPILDKKFPLEKHPNYPK